MSKKPLQPKVSVLMPAHNAEKTITRAIDSILNQSLGELEIVVVDDGSTDKTREIISSVRDGRVRILRNEQSLGCAGALNHGLALCQGEFIARMDADDEAMPERLERQVRFLHENNEVGIVGSHAFDRTMEGKVLRTRRVRLTHDELVAHVFRESPFIHPTVVFRASVLRELGGYDPTFRRAEDRELWLRASRRVRFANLPEPLLYYTVPGHAHSFAVTLLERRDSLRALLKNRNRVIVPWSAYMTWIEYSIKAFGLWLIAGVSKLRLRGPMARSGQHPRAPAKTLRDKGAD